MSLTPSPTQARPDSMASSPASSHVLDLTPRTRLRKLMSAFDEDDSDKENTKEQRKDNAIMQTRPQLEPLASQQWKRSKMTAMLQHDSDDDESDAGQTAYERLKQRLNANTATTHSRSASPVQGHASSRKAADTRPLDPVSPSPAPRSSQNSRRSASPRSIKANHNMAPITWSDTDSDPEPIGTSRNRLQELVAKKRAEREARERDLEEPVNTQRSSTPASPSSSQQDRLVHTKHHAAVVVQSENSDSDNEAGKKFTSEARPSRKASKKAIEEMRRETQRMSRNMQLAHEARTKIKFTTAELFKKMGFRRPEDAAPSSSEAVPSSDSEACANRVGTPPSSPPSLKQQILPAGKQATVPTTVPAVATQPVLTVESSDDDGDAPSLEELMRAASSDQALTRLSCSERSKTGSKPSVKQFSKKRLNLPKITDDDLEIVQPRVAHALAALDSVPERKEQESRSLHALRALAHLNDRPSRRKNLPKSITPAELQDLIQLRAREQVRRELDEKRRKMMDKGEHFMDDEAIEREQLETHELIDRARKEDEELAKREKEAAKKAGRNEGDALPSDDEDEDYQASDEEMEAKEVASEDEDEDEPMLSGSEDERETEDDAEESGDEVGETDDAVARKAQSAMIDDAAEDETSIEESEHDDEDQTEVQQSAIQSITPRPRRLASRRAVVDSDDEDEDATTAVPSTAPLVSTLNATQTPAKTPRAAITAAFGFAPVAQSPTLGLSQIFGGTMAGSQSQSQTQGRLGTESVDISPMIARHMMPAPSADTSPAIPGWTPTSVVLDETPSKARASQAFASQDDVLAATQLSQMPPPTQDAGFEAVDSPRRSPAAIETQNTHSTVDTILLQEDSLSMSAPAPAPAPRRIQRGLARTEVVSSQDESAESGQDADTQEIGSGNAFLVMKARKERPADPAAFVKKTSGAKNMVEEQAEESEDEYAGLGGASDDDDDKSTGSLDAETRAMIDDASGENVNARRVAAAFNAQKLAEDEKATTKLFKDVTTGAWRRRRGDQDGFFEEDDEEESAARRRAAKQREFARMRRALLADEAVGKIAQNPKREAFLKTIEDFVPEHEMDFLDETDDTPSQVPATPGADETSRAGRKRSFNETTLHTNDAEAAQRSAPRRRTGPRPIPDVRRVLSDMLGEPLPEAHDDLDADSAMLEADEDEDDANALQAEAWDEDDEHRWTTKPASVHPRRTLPSASRAAVIDRMALKRGASSTTSAGSGADRLAFSAASRSTGSFKAPSLLRRATTNASEGGSSTGVTTAAAMGMGKSAAEGGGIKRGGSAKSSVNYYVRESERRAKIVEMETARREGNARVGRLRRDASGLGSLAGGAFE